MVSISQPQTTNLFNKIPIKHFTQQPLLTSKKPQKPIHQPKTHTSPFSTIRGIFVLAPTNPQTLNLKNTTILGKIFSLHTQHTIQITTNHTHTHSSQNQTNLIHQTQNNKPNPVKLIKTTKPSRGLLDNKSQIIKTICHVVR